jgi:hypothetical protein
MDLPEGHASGMQRLKVSLPVRWRVCLVRCSAKPLALHYMWLHAQNKQHMKMKFIAIRVVPVWSLQHGTVFPMVAAQHCHSDS